MSQRWGIALSGGGAPGVAAHLGALTVLAAEGLLPAILVGSSAGGIAAGSLAAGQSAGEALRRWQRIVTDPWCLVPRQAVHAVDALLRPGPTPGLLDMGAVLKALDLPGLVGSWREGHAVMVTNMMSAASAIVHRSGPLHSWTTTQAITATAAIPGLFSGVQGPEGALYQDGGFLDDSPVDACRHLGAAHVILLRIGGGPVTVPPMPSLVELLNVSLKLGLHLLSQRANPVPADLVIDVPTRGGLVSLEHWPADVEAGVAAVTAHLPAIRAIAGTPSA